DQNLAGIRHEQQCFQTSQETVRTPVFGELNRRTCEVAVLLELPFKTLKEGEGIRRTSRKAGKHLVVIEAAHLPGVALHDGVAESDLAVTPHRDRAVTAYGDDGGSVGIE